MLGVIGERLLFLVVGRELKVQALVNKLSGEPLCGSFFGGAGDLEEVPKVLRLELSANGEGDAEDGESAGNSLGDGDLGRHGCVLSRGLVLIIRRVKRVPKPITRVRGYRVEVQFSSISGVVSRILKSLLMTSTQSLRSISFLP